MDKKKKKKNSKRENINYYFQEYNYFENIKSLSNQISFISKVLKFLLIYRYLISRLLTTFPRGNSLNRKKEKFEKAREYQLLFPRV